MTQALLESLTERLLYIFPNLQIENTFIAQPLDAPSKLTK
jgi:hypothetical protein